MEKDLTKAPRLTYSVPKNYVTNFEDSPVEYRNYQLFYDKVFEYLTLAQAKTMIVLASIKPNEFSPSEGWMLEHTKLNHGQYISARKELTNMGWISHNQVKGKKYFLITINFDVIYGYTQEQYNDYKNGKILNKDTPIDEDVKYIDPSEEFPDF